MKLIMFRWVMFGLILSLSCGICFADWGSDLKIADISNTTTAYKFANGVYVYMVTIKDHEYIIRDTVVHSESCSCKTKLEVLDNGNIERDRKNSN